MVLDVLPLSMWGRSDGCQGLWDSLLRIVEPSAPI
jgi:hypothetical protein